MFIFFLETQQAWPRTWEPSSSVVKRQTTNGLLRHWNQRRLQRWWGWTAFGGDFKALYDYERLKQWPLCLALHFFHSLQREKTLKLVKTFGCLPQLTKRKHVLLQTRLRRSIYFEEHRLITLPWFVQFVFSVLIIDNLFKRCTQTFQHALTCLVPKAYFKLSIYGISQYLFRLVCIAIFYETKYAGRMLAGFLCTSEFSIRQTI